MYFVLLAAAIAILAGVVVVAMGRGGEIGQAHRDLPMVPPLIRTAADVAMLQLPVGLFGYQEQSADEALDAVAGLLAERDAEIARLREELWRLRAQRSGGAGESRGSAGEAVHGDGGRDPVPRDGGGEAVPRDRGAEGVLPDAESPPEAGLAGAGPAGAGLAGAGPAGAGPADAGLPDAGQTGDGSRDARLSGAADGEILSSSGQAGGQPWPSP